MQTHIHTQSLAKEMLILPLNQTLQPNITIETSKNKLTFVCVSEYGQDEKSSVYSPVTSPYDSNLIPWECTNTHTQTEQCSKKSHVYEFSFSFVGPKASTISTE